MKRLILFSTVISLSLFVNSFAQSDYEIVENFKSNVKQIEQSIRNAVTLEELSAASPKIDALRTNFRANKELLDKSLYPDNFDRSIEKLETAFSIRSKDFIQIDVLQTEVYGLREQVDALNKRNTELINQLVVLESESKLSKNKIAQLEKTISELKTSLKKRDELIISLIDSLLPSSVISSELSVDQKEQIFNGSESNSVLYNIKRSIRDNLRFLDVTTLKPDDVAEIKREQQEFSRLWKSVGPKMVDIYAEKKGDANELKEIDAAFSSWHDALRDEVWNSIREEFSIYNLNLRNFSSGNEFTNSVTAFIDDEIKNVGVRGEEQVKRTYTTFADSVWFGTIKPQWASYLIDNKIMTDAQKDTIETKLSEWKEKIEPAGFNWLYLIIGALVVMVIVLFFIKRKPSPPKFETPKYDTQGTV